MRSPYFGERAAEGSMRTPGGSNRLVRAASFEVSEDAVIRSATEKRSRLSPSAFLGDDLRIQCSHERTKLSLTCCEDALARLSAIENPTATPKGSIMKGYTRVLSVNDEMATVATADKA
jgi:hypothetical protein